MPWLMLWPTITQLDLALILLQGIRGALSNQHFQINPNNRKPAFCMLVNSQNTIGWQHPLKGSFSKQRTQIQGSRILEDPQLLDQEKETGGGWLKLAPHHLWTPVWQVWLTQNEDLHGHKKDEKERNRLKKLRPGITALHPKQDLLLTPLTSQFLNSPSTIACNHMAANSKHGHAWNEEWVLQML
jgi:hypothetical protein